MSDVGRSYSNTKRKEIGKMNLSDQFTDCMAERLTVSLIDCPTD